MTLDTGQEVDLSWKRAKKGVKKGISQIGLQAGPGTGYSGNPGSGD